MIKCPNCGCDIGKNSRFCEKCGYKVQNTIISKIIISIVIVIIIIAGISTLTITAVNAFNNTQLQNAMNNEAFTGHKILIQSITNIDKAKDTLQNRLYSQYNGKVFIKKSYRDKFVLYTDKNIKPESVISYLSKPVLSFKKKDAKKGTWVDTGINDNDIEAARVDGSSGQWTVGLEFTKSGTEKFAKLTKEMVGQQLAIFYNGKLQSAPFIEEPILEGRAQISGNKANGGFMLEEAKEMEDILNSAKGFKVIEIK